MSIDTGGDIFPVTLKGYRQRRRMTQRQLADRSTISVRTIRDLESGRVQRPRDETLRLLADALELAESDRADLDAATGRVLTTTDLTTLFGTATLSPPHALDSLIGRENEVTSLHELLAPQGYRLVTITGLAGVGKSRMVLELAKVLHESDRFPVLWKSRTGAEKARHRAPLSDRLAHALRTALEKLFSPAEGVGELAELIGRRPTLLALDGYEASDIRPDHIGQLLQQCPGLRVLIAARGPVGLPGERVVHLPPLAVPGHLPSRSVGALAEVSSVKLLLRHVRRVRPDFTMRTSNAGAVAAICDQLDGIPTALEDVASWFFVDTPELITERLRTTPFDLFKKESDELRASLLRSMAALNANESLVLARLSRRQTHWTINEMAELVGSPIATAMRCAQRLLALGLVRPATSDDHPTYSVLTLVGALQREPAPGAR
ncbi:helix-turn-helix domain-containing protein [Streptomyces xiamenensis]|uniref:helix-turn-helix domain-containing protein n=1 Tax=Streptomyces xiamenensis TaxID=408015 RepID=UPI0036E02E5E